MEASQRKLGCHCRRDANAEPTKIRNVLTRLLPTKKNMKRCQLRSKCLIKPNKDHILVLNQHLWVGRINEPRDVTESGLYPQVTGDSEVLPDLEMAWSDLHLGKILLTWAGRLDCMDQGSLLGLVAWLRRGRWWLTLQSVYREGKMGSGPLGLYMCDS